MLKEIHEQPQTILDTMRGRYSYDTGEADLPDIGLTPKEFAAVERPPETPVLGAAGVLGLGKHAVVLALDLLERVVHGREKRFIGVANRAVEFELDHRHAAVGSEERRGGEECRSGWSPYH